jgi:hypothetical protein
MKIYGNMKPKFAKAIDTNFNHLSKGLDDENVDDLKVKNPENKSSSKKLLNPITTLPWHLTEDYKNEQ